jgi:FkbM family methyltransferase
VALTPQRVARALIPRPLRNWLRRPGRSLAWSRDHVAHLLGLDPTVELRPGWTLRCHPAAWRLAFAAQRHDPEQVEELDAFVRACTPGMTLVDAGAHFGVFSLAALHFGGPDATAVAVDPAPSAVRMLRVEARLNGVADRLRIVRAAVASRDGRLELVDAGVPSAGYFVRPESGHPTRERTSVAAVTIDSLCRRHALRATHLKLDVEGFEADALRGAAATLGGPAPPLVFVELHNEIVARNGGEPGGTLDLLERFGYEMRDAGGRPLDRAAILRRPLIRIVARPRPR